MTRGGSAGGASLQVAGQSLIEYQARSLAACGVRHIVIMVETLPAPLVAAFDRLRAEGFSIDTARSPQDAADRIHPDETVFVLSAGIVASASLLQDLVALPVPAIVTLVSDAAASTFERIDRDDRWGGIATIRGEHLRQTSAKLGEWDFAATTLRVALQHGAHRYAAPANAFLGLIESPADAANASTKLAIPASDQGQSAFARFVATPVGNMGLSFAVRSSISFEILSVVPLALLLAALLLGWIGWPAIALVVFGVGGIAQAIATGMATSALRTSWAVERFPLFMLVTFSALLGFGAIAWSNADWGVYPLAAWIVANAVLFPGQPSRWHPDTYGLALLIACLAAAGEPVSGLVLAICWQVLPPAIDRAKALL